MDGDEIGHFQGHEYFDAPVTHCTELPPRSFDGIKHTFYVDTFCRLAIAIRKEDALSLMWILFIGFIDAMTSLLMKRL